MAKKFEDLGPTTRSSQGVCFRCKKRDTTHYVQVMIREGRSASFAGRSVCRSKNLCELCAVEVFESALKILYKEQP